MSDALVPFRLARRVGDEVVRGSDRPDGFGMALWMVDADGDGDDELVVGAPFDGAPASYRGAVYLFDPSSWSW
jgi:hypothetical protein